MDNYKVYMHTAPNGKKYIGITKQTVVKRWGNGNGYKNCMFYNAIQKYGWDNIKHEVLFEGLTKDQAEKKEVEFIAFYKSNKRQYGYNIENGGNTIGKHSEETKKKISNSHVGIKNPMYGKHQTEETKKRISIHSAKSKPVICIETNKEYISASECSRVMELSVKHIIDVCNGHRKTTGKYHFRYV